MFCVTMNLKSAEWLRIQQAAGKQWLGERLSSSEICRRYTLAGMKALINVLDADTKAVAASVPGVDGSG
jgi:hypothetical protein